MSPFPLKLTWNLEHRVHASMWLHCNTSSSYHRSVMYPVDLDLKIAVSRVRLLILKKFCCQRAVTSFSSQKQKCSATQAPALSRGWHQTGARYAFSLFHRLVN